MPTNPDLLPKDQPSSRLEPIIEYEKAQKLLDETEAHILKGNADGALGSLARARLKIADVMRKLLSSDERSA